MTRKKKPTKKYKPRNEFRYNINAKHPNYIFEVEEKTFGIKNAPLKVNPKKTDKRKSYMRNGVVNGTHYDYSKKTMKNMQFSREDLPNVKAKIRNAKKNRKKTTKK